MHKEILDALDSPGEIELTLSEPTVASYGYAVWSSPYFPTKNRWRNTARHKYVCMQFDGQSTPQANASSQEELLIKRVLQERCHGLGSIVVGKHFSVQECVSIAANSALFVGVDSGMSHLCHSVGVPIFLLEFGLATNFTHAGKAHILCRGLDDLKGWFDRYTVFLHITGSPDAQSISR